MSCRKKLFPFPSTAFVLDRLHLMKVRVLLCGSIAFSAGCVSAAAHLQRLSPLSHTKTTENGRETQEMLVVAVEARTVAWDLISLVFVETAVSKHLWSVVFLCSLEVEHGTHTQSGCRSPMASRVGATWMATARAKGKAGPRSMRSSDVGLRWRRRGSRGASCRADRGHGWTWEDPGDGEKLQTG